MVLVPLVVLVILLVPHLLVLLLLVHHIPSHQGLQVHQQFLHCLLVHLAFHSHHVDLAIQLALIDLLVLVLQQDQGNHGNLGILLRQFCQKVLCYRWLLFYLLDQLVQGLQESHQGLQGFQVLLLIQ